MERASRLIVISSIALAAATHVWLATTWQPGLGAASIGAFVLTFALAYVSLTTALIVVLGTAYIAPALLWVAFDRKDHHLLIVWLVAVAGLVLARYDWSHWHLPQRWRWPLIAWALVIAVSWPVVAGREIDFSLVAARTLTTTNGAYLAQPGIAAAFVVILALGQMLGILWIDLLWRRFGATGLGAFERWVIVPLIAGIGISCLVGIYQAAVDITWMNLPLWSQFGRAGGLTNDANSLGIGAALCAPLAVLIAWRFKQGVWLGLAAFTLLTGGMWVAGSRTALLAFGAGSTGLVIAELSRRGRWQPRIGRMIALVAGALVVLAMAVVPRDFTSANPLQRLFARVPRLEAQEIRRAADELWNRFGYGPAANEIFREHPITGVGIGGFHVVAPNYIYLESGLQVGGDNAQNWWRHQIAELGLIGALPSLAFSLVVLALRRGRDEPPPDVTVLRGVIAGVGLASLLGVPTQHPATWMAFVTVVFWLGARITPITTSDAVRSPRSHWIAAWAIVAIVATGVTQSARNDLRVVRRALRASLPYAYGVSEPEGLSVYGEVRRMARDAVWVIAVHHRWLQLTLWPLHADLATHPVTVRVTLDGKEVVRHAFSDREPVTYLLEIPEARFVFLETQVSRPPGGDWALQSAVTWQRELPTGVPNERVVRLGEPAERPE